MTKQATSTTKGEPMTKHTTRHDEITLTPRVAIGTVEYWNGTYEIDQWEYEILRSTGCKITLYTASASDAFEAALSTRIA